MTQVRKGHLAVFAGTGLIYTTLNGDSFDGPTYGGVLGARLYSRESGDRLFLSAQFAFNTQESLGDPREGYPPAWFHTNATTLTAGWRFRFESGFLVDLGAGGGLYLSSPRARAKVIADLTLALGWEF